MRTAVPAPAGSVAEEPAPHPPAVETGKPAMGRPPKIEAREDREQPGPEAGRHTQDLEELKSRLLAKLAETDVADGLSQVDLLGLFADAKREIHEQRERRERETQEAQAASLRRRELPADWRNAFADDERAQGVRAESAGDGLFFSLRNLGRVDIEYIARITGLSCQAVLDALGSAVYQNPETCEACFYRGWETADEYLSGFIIAKLRAARVADKRWPGVFERNILALEAVLSVPVPAEGIYASLTSPWISPDVINDFMNHLFIDPVWATEHPGDLPSADYDPLLRKWRISSGYRGYCIPVNLTTTYGTEQCDGLKLLEKTLNHSAIPDKDIALKEKQKRQQQEFANWIFADAVRRERLTRIYNEKFGCVRKRRYDGSFLNFPGMSPEIELRPYQKNAVARILFSGDTLLAHEVGAGKTFIMIAAAMELRRTGRSRKNLFIVPNNIVRQWRDFFLSLYPAADLLLVEPGNFTPKKRQAALKDLRDRDYDGVIMASSCAEQIPLSLDWRKKRLDLALDEVQRQLGDPAVARRTGLEQIRDKLEKAMEKLVGDVEDIFADIAFDLLGVGALFLDEAHNYKNIPLKSKARNIRGVNLAGSKKCADMLARVQAVREGGGLAVLSTGTPIANSFSDVYTLQQYLQPGALRFLGLDGFDAWAGNFAESRDVFEIDVDTQRFRTVTRFVRFHNLPELSALFGQVAEFSPKISRDIPECVNRRDLIAEKTPELAQYLQSLSARADLVRDAGRPLPRADNMLKITTDGRKAALDLRLVQPPAQPTLLSLAAPNKAQICAQNVLALWREHAAQKSAQIIFCDLSVPKQGFNVYEELKGLLMHFGIPEEEIAFVHDHDTPVRRAALYARVRAGLVRVLLGSTFKLGLGVNIQTKLVALHHLDVPWRPADMVQREGRILREGNENDTVHIFRYVTEGSFDAYSWQILETKQRFIAQFLGGDLARRSGAELDDAVLSYAEIKALAVGDPLLRERVESAVEVERLSLLRGRWREERETMRLELLSLPNRLAALEARHLAIRQDAEDYAARRVRHTPAERRNLGRRILEEQRAHIGLPEEKPLFVYQNFQVLLPAFMAEDKPCLWLAGRERYYVKTGSDATGCLVRMDNELEALPELAEKCAEEAEQLARRIPELERELQAPDPYAGALAAQEKRLADLDARLHKEKQR
jgi:hypothetical protein